MWCGVVWCGAVWWFGCRHECVLCRRVGGRQPVHHEQEVPRREAVLREAREVVPQEDLRVRVALCGGPVPPQRMLLTGVVLLFECRECRKDGDCPAGESCLDFTCEANPAVVTVLRYNNLTVDDFTDALKDQVCTNLLALSPGGICEVLGVFPGSVVVVVRIVYPTSEQATVLAVTLEEDSGATQQTLIEDFPAGTTVVVESVEEQPVPTPPLPTLSPSNVVATPSTGCVPSLGVSWSAPTGTTAPISSYLVECLQTGGSGTSVLVAGTTTTATLTVQADKSYTCSVTSISTQGTSPAVAGNAATYTCVY